MRRATGLCVGAEGGSGRRRGGGGSASGEMSMSEGGWPSPGSGEVESDDRCANPRNLFWAFHAPYPSKIAQIGDTQKNYKKKLYFSKFYKNYIFQKINISIFITCNYISHKIKGPRGYPKDITPERMFRKI